MIETMLFLIYGTLAIDAAKRNGSHPMAIAGMVAMFSSWGYAAYRLVTWLLA